MGHKACQTPTPASFFTVICHNSPIIPLYSAAAAAKSLQSCLTLCDPMDCSLPGSSVHGIFQARVLEWVALAFSLEVARHTLNLSIATATAKSLQLCLTLCDPMDDSPPGSPVPGILQARILEWVAISFSNVLYA